MQVNWGVRTAAAADSCSGMQRSCARPPVHSGQLGIQGSRKGHAPPTYRRAPHPYLPDALLIYLSEPTCPTPFDSQPSPYRPSACRKLKSTMFLVHPEGIHHSIYPIPSIAARAGGRMPCSAPVDSTPSQVLPIRSTPGSTPSAQEGGWESWFWSMLAGSSRTEKLNQETITSEH